MLKINALSLAYGDHRVIADVSFALDKGEIGCLLGPSGCGKSSLLRAIAGFERPQSGQIWLHDRLVSDTNSQLAPEKRRIGMVFQDFALFPHLTVAQNVGFALRHERRAVRQKRVMQLLDMVGLGALGQRYSHALSGGQQQRVALARALAPRPDLLLLDEPFSGLDTELRESLAAQVRDIIKQEGITALLVTHDQHEAFAIADNIGVLHAGQLLQWDSPQGLYQRPANRTVASFVGQGTLLPVTKTTDGWHCVLGRLTSHSPQPVSHCLLRPEHVILGQTGLPAKVAWIRFQGAQSLCQVVTQEGCALLANYPADKPLHVGQSIHVALCKTDLVLL